MLRTDVSALYVDPRGPYPKLVADWWDEKRDARNYAGPNPVVAHPPCQLWGKFAPINFKRWGGEHNRPGNDGGCFEHAVRALHAFGGVIEHPAESKAWAAHFLGEPKGIGWAKHPLGGWSCEIWQSAYGHRAKKRTWLFYMGKSEPFDGNWKREPGTHQIGYHDQRGPERNKPTVGKREASESPLSFAKFLLELAAHARR
jgi:hypothetical protein